MVHRSDGVALCGRGRANGCAYDRLSSRTVRNESRSSQQVAESLFIGLIALAGLVLVAAMNAHGKAQVFERTDPDRRGK